MGKHGRRVQLSTIVDRCARRTGPQPAMDVASAAPLAPRNGSPVSEAPQLVFELSSAAAPVLSNSVRMGTRRVARARALAAIQNYALLESVHQRSAPLRTVVRHMAAPFAKLATATGAAIEETPVEARRFVAGAVAGALSKTATAPLEKLRMQLMTNGQSRPLDIIAETWRDGGVTAFFGGNAADVLRVMPSKAIELMAFDVFKSVLHRKGECPGPGGTMLSGALAGLCSTTVCFPLETVRTRMAVSPKSYSGITDCFQKTVLDKGLGQLYRGVSASMIGAVPYTALRFGAYDGLKVLYRRRFGDEPMPPHVLVAAGALAGLAASTATFPLEVVRRRMMAGAAHGSVLAAMRTIAAEEGWMALYRGLGVSCIKQAPQTGITLWAYDSAKNLLKAA